MHLDACRLSFASLHCASHSIFAPLHVSHFQLFAPHLDVMFAHCGAMSTFFCPKCLPNVEHCVAPVCRAGATQMGELGPFVFFCHMAQVHRARRPRWGNLGSIGFSDGHMACRHHVRTDAAREPWLMTDQIVPRKKLCSPSSTQRDLQVSVLS